jgi:hypothetical protein
MRKIILSICLLTFALITRADYLLVPMDMSQANHLKAYGVAFQSLKAENTVQWLLNYRGGAFLMPANEANESLLKTAGVSYERTDDKTTQGIIVNVLSGTNNMNMVTMNHLPRIAVYAPPYTKQYDDAVTLALTYAGIDYTVIYDREVLRQDLSQYDWIHLHHEDFTGQYNKWQYYYEKASWFKNEKAITEATAKDFGFAKASQLKLAVAKKLRTFVENGGQLFAMCSGTDKLDIALAADGVDIVPTEIDGDPVDGNANAKLNFANTFAFQNFTVDLIAKSHNHSDIAVSTDSKSQKDKFNLAVIDAKKDLTGAMLVQNHETAIKEFLGNTTAFNKQFIKPSVSVLGSTASDVKYLHGQRGKGYFTFYAGHDPEDFMHLVGDGQTDLDHFRQSAGYRLILNNVLMPATAHKTLGIADISQVSIKTYPNPFVNSFTVEINSDEVKQAKLTVYNLEGQIMLADNINSESGTFKKQYNTEGFASGLYVVEVSNAKGSIAKSLLSRLDQK